MDNVHYLLSNGVTDPEIQHKCLEVMGKYHENHWWEPGVDERTFAYYQILEDTYITGNAKGLETGLPLLLGRPIYGPMVELHPANLTFLRDEAERAWKQGTPSYTKEEIGQIHMRLIARMQGWGENVMAVEVPE